MVVENMQTAYQIGKGMLKHVEEMARQAEELENPTEPEVVEDEIVENDVVLAAVEEDAEPMEITFVEPEVEEVAAPTPRRMKFKIEESAA